MPAGTVSELPPGVGTAITERVAALVVSASRRRLTRAEAHRAKLARLAGEPPIPAAHAATQE
ncbi:hypothetical protein I6A60_00570 [Frankia sp. AgB1.9]|uniref:hypothetical protein n=1 Tax=unclassified Frankia TaxID=2632575 RepID=UPI0019343125|nr:MULTISPECIES: hypothetical protein [unclassified Frankia]MBL7487374.1 hypothetical protein [Frankia sp. AgW1.1]MBL7546382.1 hypothetical protein [Frankia sp. AgB1.9]MBL7618573.1 hypothetical protein [Frankia sp. AgB1.8]